MSSPVRPLQAVLDAFGSGATTVADIVARTGMADDVVRASLDHLIRTGRVTATEMASGCPDGGCGSCASSVEGAPGCGAVQSSPQRSGPVLVALSLRKPD